MTVETKTGRVLLDKFIPRGIRQHALDLVTVNSFCEGKLAAATVKKRKSDSSDRKETKKRKKNVDTSSVAVAVAPVLLPDAGAMFMLLPPLPIGSAALVSPLPAASAAFVPSLPSLAELDTLLALPPPDMLPDFDFTLLDFAPLELDISCLPSIDGFDPLSFASGL